MKLLIPFLVLMSGLGAALWWDHAPTRADLVFVNRGEVFTLDPQRMSYVQDFRLAYALYEGLLRWNNEDLSIQPAAADLPDISSDQLTYTFHLRSDAQWSNGDPVTAHDFVYSWQRLLFPDTAADYSNLFFVIEGAEEFFHWRQKHLADYTSGGTQGRDALNAVSLWDEAQRQLQGMAGIHAPDDRTLVVKLRRPCPYFLDLLCFAVCHPVHRPTVEGWPEQLIDSPAMRKRGWIGVPLPAWSERRFVRIDPMSGRLEQKHDWARPQSLIGNGPYRLTEWRYKRDMRLERNRFFHSPHIVRNNSVHVLSIEDANTAVLAFEAGKVDWLGDVAAEYQADLLEQRRRYENRYRAEIDSMLAAGKSRDKALASLPKPEHGERRNIHALPAFGTDFYSFNCRPTLGDGRANPFADARVRRAFALAVDKQAIVRNATRLNEPAMNSLVPPGSIPGYRAPEGLPHDAERGRAELAAAGWRDRNKDGLIENEAGDAFPVVDLLWTTNSSRYKWMSLELKSQWERELGVRVELRSADTKFYKEDLKLGKYMIARGRWYGDYGDPTTFLDINKTGDGNNDRGYSNPAFDAMLQSAEQEIDPANRMKILEDAERFLFEQELPLLPICQLVQLYMYEPDRLNGLTAHPRLIQYLWQIEVTRD